LDVKKGSRGATETTLEGEWGGGKEYSFTADVVEI